MTPEPVRLVGAGLEVVVVPAWGGKTISIRERRRGTELLFQPAARPVCPREDFGPWAFGWDDCWPSVNAGGPHHPDHGVLWRASPVVEEQTPSLLRLRYEDPSGQWLLRKSWLVGTHLAVAVEIENTGFRPFEGFWTFHGLVRLEDDLRLVFPGDDHRLTVFGPEFPPQSLPPEGTASKFWVPGRVPVGRCAIDYPTLGLRYGLEWDPAELPFLGLWVTRGGFQGDRNLAWEPSDGFYDSVETARAHRALPRLAPGERRHIRLDLFWGDLPPTGSAGSLG